jgi:hypothetical protein
VSDDVMLTVVALAEATIRNVDSGENITVENLMRAAPADKRPQMIGFLLAIISDVSRANPGVVQPILDQKRAWALDR